MPPWGNEGVDGIEIGKRRLAGERLLTGDEREHGQVDQTLSKAAVRQGPNGLHKREGLGRYCHGTEDTGRLSGFFRGALCPVPVGQAGPRTGGLTERTREIDLLTKLGTL